MGGMGGRNGNLPGVHWFRRKRKEHFKNIRSSRFVISGEKSHKRGGGGLAPRNTNSSHFPSGKEVKQRKKGL